MTKIGRFTGYSAPLPDLILLNPFATEYNIQRAITLLKTSGYDQVPIAGMLGGANEQEYLEAKIWIGRIYDQTDNA